MFYVRVFLNLFVKFTEKHLRRRVTTRGGGLPCPFKKIGKKCPNLGRECLDCGHLWVKLLV